MDTGAWEAPETQKLLARVLAGDEWLRRMDAEPPGRFYLWWQAKLRPGGPMPAQSEEVQARYAEWHRGFESWLKLYGELERICGDGLSVPLADGLHDRGTRT